MKQKGKEERNRITRLFLKYGLILPDSKDDLYRPMIGTFIGATVYIFCWAVNGYMIKVYPVMQGHVWEKTFLEGQFSEKDVQDAYMHVYWQMIVDDSR